MKTRHFILIGLTILLWFSFRFLLPLTLPFVLAYFFAKLVSPMIQFLVNKLKWRRKVSIFLVVFFTLLILGGFSVYIITLIISQGMLLLQKIPVYGQICGRMLEKMCSHCDRMLELADGSSFDYLESNGFLFCYQADDGVVLNQRSCDGMLKVYRDAGMSKERLDRLIGRMHLTEQPWKNEKNEKIIYYGAPFPVAKVHADMEPYFDAVAISLDGMGDFAGEIGINGINKATGMERYLNHVGISRENCIAIGDGPNDLQMMEYAGISVAMGNARDEVKRLADMVTDHIDEDGILHAFERLGLINDCI